MKINPADHTLLREVQKQDNKKNKDPFDLDLKVTTKAQKMLNVNDASAYCGSDDDCTGCGCNTCCSSC